MQNRYYFVTWETRIFEGKDFWRCVDMYYGELELEGRLKTLMYREELGEVRNIKVTADCR